MGKTFIISDVHGDYQNLLKALRNAGIIDKHGNRQLARRHRLYSIGDLANCSGDTFPGDFACLSLVGTVIDAMVIGNHEIQYFDPENTWTNFYYFEKLSEILHHLNDTHRIWPALSINGYLVSHAGVHKKLGFPDAKSVVGKASYEWVDKNYHHWLFSSCGYARGGRSPFGGLVWCDWKKEFQSDFPQIVGHSSGKTIRINNGSMCIDTGKGSKLPTIIEI